MENSYLKTAGSSSASKTPSLEGVQDLNAALLPLLKGVSRSFYLSIRILPGRIRSTFALAYLLARAADTISDAETLPRETRKVHLETFRRFVQSANGDRQTAFEEILASFREHPNASERFLMEHLSVLFDLFEQLPERQRAITEKVLLTLTQGMREDLEYFTTARCLKTPFDTERYAYLVAGCVGEFWTDLLIAEGLLHWQRQRMIGKAIRFGQGLQMINILRDLPRDLDLGRCYLSSADLSAYQMDFAELQTFRKNTSDGRSTASKLQKLYKQKIDLAKSWLAEGMVYVRTIPRFSLRLRLAVLWPLFIGLKTLEQLEATPLEEHFEHPVKIPRKAVYRLMVATVILSVSNGLLKVLYYQHGGIE